MKNIEVDEQLYNYIASQTQHIGESASDILRRLLLKDKILDAELSVNEAIDATGSELPHSVGSDSETVDSSNVKQHFIPADVNEVQENQLELQRVAEQQVEHDKQQETVQKEVSPAKSKTRKSSARHTESSRLCVPELGLRDLLQSSEYLSLSLSISRFLMVLAVLYKENPDKFAVACAIKGKKRSYFSQNQQELAEAGRTTKPRAIPESPYWVITNVNAGRKRLIMSQLMKSMAYQASLIDLACDSIAPSAK